MEWGRDLEGRAVGEGAKAGEEAPWLAGEEDEEEDEEEHDEQSYAYAYNTCSTTNSDTIGKTTITRTKLNAPPCHHRHRHLSLSLSGNWLLGADLRERRFEMVASQFHPFSLTQFVLFFPLINAFICLYYLPLLDINE